MDCISSLPSETLLNIFQYVECSEQDGKATRLACRIFYDVGQRYCMGENWRFLTRKFDMLCKQYTSHCPAEMDESFQYFLNNSERRTLYSDFRKYFEGNFSKQESHDIIISLDPRRRITQNKEYGMQEGDTTTTVERKPTTIKSFLLSLKKLLQRVCAKRYLEIAVRENDVEAVKFILSKERFEINQDFAPLQEACKAGFVDIVRLMIDDISIDDQDQEMNDLFHLAARHGRVKVMRELWPRIVAYRYEGIDNKKDLLKWMENTLRRMQNDSNLSDLEIDLTAAKELLKQLILDTENLPDNF